MPLFSFNSWALLGSWWIWSLLLWCYMWMVINWPEFMLMAGHHHLLLFSFSFFFFIINFVTLECWFGLSGSGFWPTLAVFLQRIPVLGWLFQQPFVTSVRWCLHMLSPWELTFWGWCLYGSLFIFESLANHFCYLSLFLALQFLDRYRGKRVPV